MMTAGNSLKESLRLYLESTNNPLAADLRERWTLAQGSRGAAPRPFESHYQAAFWELIERGSQGQPILEALISLENEVDLAAGAELDLHISTLPFKVLMPLLLLQFPAFMLLLLGPLLRELSQQLGATI